MGCRRVNIAILGRLHEDGATARICISVRCCKALDRVALQHEKLVLDSKLHLSCHGVAKSELAAYFSL